MLKLPQTWCSWILGWVFFALIGIQLIESTHHHESEALQDACVVCHMVAHQPLNLLPPAVAPIALTLFILFILSPRPDEFRVTELRHAGYSSRAPPSTTA